MCWAQQRLQWTRKKTLTASERDEEVRAAFRTMSARLMIDDLVVVDEMGSSIALTRLYARLPKGTRAYSAVPRNHGRNTTLVSALTPAGLTVATTLDGAIDTAAFEVFCEHFLCSGRRTGQTVLLDNLAVHKSHRVQRLIEAVDCQLLVLPAHSPDFAPIELAYSKVKASLRWAGARTKEALETAITAAIAIITPADARAFFRHCGYQAAPQTS